MNEPENPDPINRSGENTPDGVPSQASAATLEAGRAALEQHESEMAAPKGKRKGRPPIHGRYMGKGKSKANGKPGAVPLGAVDNGAGSVLLDDVPALAPEIGVEVIEPAFNEE